MNREEAFKMLDQMAKGIAEMFGSNCETIIHDLADPLHPVLAIYNGHVSGRSVGSTLDVTGVEQDLYLDTDVVNLLAVTPSGQQTKSSTFSIKGEDYHLGFGINYDFTPLAYANRVLLDLMHTEVDFHSALYKPRDAGISDLFDSALLLRDRCAEPAWTSVNSPALAAAAREGLGVAVLPACLTEADVAAGRLVRLEVEGLTLRNQNQLVVHRDKTITPPLRLFMEAVTAEEG